MSIRIDFLSYEGERNNERHPHAQFVLPIAGELEISIGGAEGRLTPLLRGVRRARRPAFAAGDRLERLSYRQLRSCRMRRPCGGTTGGTNLSSRFRSHPTPDRVRGAVQRPLFHSRAPRNAGCPCSSIPSFERPVCRPSRLAVLERLIDAHPGAPWTVGEMARRIGISPSRLHALSRPNGASARRHGWRNAVSGMCGNGWRNRICRLRIWRCGPGTPIKARSPAPCSA